MVKNDYIEIFNAMIRGTPVSFSEKLVPMVSDYLTENNVKNSDKIINLIINNPEIIKNTIPNCVDYFCRKYNILILKQIPKQRNDQIKTILYYE